MENLSVPQSIVNIGILEYANNPVLVTDTSGAVFAWNAAAEGFWGYKADEVMGERLSPFLSQLEHKEGQFSTIATLRSGQKQAISYRNTRLVENNKVFYLLQVDEQKATEQVKVSADMLTQMKRLSLVASKTTNAVIITDPNGLIEWTNEGFEIISGYTREEVMGKKPGSFLQGEDTSLETVKYIREKLNKQEPIDTEILNYTKSGVPYWLRLQITPIFDDQGQLTQFIAIESDVTERKEETLNMQALTQTVDEIFARVVFDPSAKIIDANARFAELMGYEQASDIIGKEHRIFLGEEYAESKDYQAFWEKLRRGEAHRREVKRITKNGEELWLYANYNPVIDDKGRLKKVIKLANDITEKRAAAQTIRDQNEALNQMSTPVAQVWEGILFLPLVGIMDSKRAHDTMTTVLTKITETQAEVFILDISGIAIMDTAVANNIIKITKATKLMGCTCIISGISGAVAQTVVDLEIQTGDIMTTSNMQAALAKAFSMTGINLCD